MARIHIARSLGAEGFSRLVAAKRLDPQLANDAEFVEMFLDEARVASKVRHRNVVPVLDVVTIDGEVIMVQELVHGAPLHKLFARAQQANVRIPVNIAVSIAMQTLCGLHAAHEAVDETGMSLNIVHRDVSPQNIMIATDGTARLLDFGVAKTAAAAHVTRTGTFKGKLAYSPPEQLTGGVTRQTDLYALAVVLWELLVGERVHAGRSEAEVYASIMRSTPPPLTQILAKRHAIGKLDDMTWRRLRAIEPILQKALSHDAKARYATAAEMEQALLVAVEPAPIADVALWLRSLAQDLLDQTDQLIAAEEASWRKAQGSGVLPTMKPTSSESRRRASTSLPTQAAIPSARARLWQSKLFGNKSTAGSAPAPRVRVPLLAFAIADGAAVLLIVLLLLGRSSAPTRASAATLPAESSQHVLMPTTMPHAAQAVRTEAASDEAASDTESDAESAISSASAERRPARTTKPAKRRPVIRRPRKRVEAAVHKPTDCSIPFYYEGSKKIFKPSCI
jgi:eukaryotic-like serine/threonine-protein kinase